MGFAAGDENLYRYVGNGPTNATDPSGLRPPVGKPKNQAQAALEDLREMQRPKDVEQTDNAIRDIIQKSRKYTAEEKRIITDAVLSLVKTGRFVWDHPVGLAGRCYDWVDEFNSNRQAGKLHTELRSKKIIGNYLQVDQQVWYNKLLFGETTGFGHTAIRITLSDGTTFYIDDGYLRGLDQVFMQAEVPSFYSPQNGPPIGLKISPPPAEEPTPPTEEDQLRFQIENNLQQNNTLPFRLP